VTLGYDIIHLAFFFFLRFQSFRPCGMICDCFLVVKMGLPGECRPMDGMLGYQGRYVFLLVEQELFILRWACFLFLRKRERFMRR